MLRCVMRDVKGRQIMMPRLLSLQVHIDEGVPADSLYAVFPLTETEELCGVSLFDENKLLFTGVVDEEEHERTAQGEYLKISARSLAAHLLDNEAMPCAYNHPSLAFIYERYVKPFGIKSIGDDDAVYYGEQAVAKGSSCWRVLKKFCSACYSSVPRISADGILYPKGIQREETTVFGDGGRIYTSICEVKKRCEELSAVNVKTAGGSSYSLPIQNTEAIQRGIKRERYLNATLTESPMRCADEMIANGTGKAYSVQLSCPSCLLGCEGNQATLRDNAFGVRDRLYISAVHYHLTEDGEHSTITLKRRTT